MHAASGGGAGTCLHRRTLQCAAGRQLLCRQLSLAHRARHVARASPGGGSDDSPDKPDIDALAKMLSAEAARLRASMEAGGDEPSSSAAAARQRSAASKQQPQMQYDVMETVLFKEVGPGGFDSVDFELVQQLGSIRLQPAFPESQTMPTAVIVYAARYHPRLAYTRPVPTLLKEYLPISRPVAMNELLLLQHLFRGLPDDKYAAAIEPGPRGAAATGYVPVVPLLGYFLSAPSDQGAYLSTDESLDSIWMVYKWEGLRPLGMLMMEGPPQPMYGLLKSKEAAEQEAWQGRCEVLRATAAGLLAAVDFCHSADVVHGSLSSGSVLLGPWEELERSGGTGGRAGQGVEVKLDGFGFGKWFVYGEQPRQRQSEMVGGRLWPSTAFGAQSGDAEALEAGKREDLQASALLLLEAFVSCLAPGTPRAMRPPPRSDAAMAAAAADATAPAKLDRVALQRLLFEVFHDDIRGFRNYCLQDTQQYGRLVELLDEQDGGGWELLSDMLRGDKSALQLTQHRFLVPKSKQGQGGGGKGGLGGFTLPWQSKQ